MRLTKLAHACVRLEKDGEALAIDPRAWGGGSPDGASAVLVTQSTSTPGTRTGCAPR